MKRTVLAVAVMAAWFTALGARVALATPGSGITTSNLSVGRFGNVDVRTETEDHELELRVNGDSDVYAVRNTFAPNGHSGWHTHPGPSLITVTRGTITAYSDDGFSCTVENYPAGTGFLDPGGGHVHLLRNVGAGEAETIAVQLLPAGAPRRIDAPDPGNCSL